MKKLFCPVCGRELVGFVVLRSERAGLRELRAYMCSGTSRCELDSVHVWVDKQTIGEQVND